ncbi:uncharacterized protein B0H18DRAFT_456628 [Fomitopsis serialis]|uniref:uncharacterized protein n=1 Tax=Fomitopsis serialis TaxID=139415 RepID=UPI0020082888|nr:uncharacterized protein B0H18DRAFT_456628 [Neoantrodia serialis]KAH9923610.1 hypothetical protein B0H18DRAFT_456628 [Neoantrodia serialis]
MIHSRCGMPANAMLSQLSASALRNPSIYPPARSPSSTAVRPQGRPAGPPLQPMVCSEAFSLPPAAAHVRSRAVAPGGGHLQLTITSTQGVPFAGNSPARRPRVRTLHRNGAALRALRAQGGCSTRPPMR